MRALDKKFDHLRSNRGLPQNIKRETVNLLFRKNRSSYRMGVEPEKAPKRVTVVVFQFGS